MFWLMQKSGAGQAALVTIIPAMDTVPMPSTAMAKGDRPTTNVETIVEANERLHSSNTYYG